MNELKEIKFPSVNKDLPFKLSLSKLGTVLIDTGLSKNDPICNLLNNYSEIEKIQETTKEHFTKYLYFNKKNVNNILYNENKNIHIKYKDYCKSLSYNYYFLLLIMEQPDILNYTFDEEYIYELSKEYQNRQDAYTSIIMSKIILNLIDDFTETNDCDCDKNKNLSKIKTEYNSKCDTDGLELVLDAKFERKKFLSNNIDDIFIDIINILITTSSLKTKDYLIENFDIKNINLSPKMFERIKESLNADGSYINDYLISNETDLSNTKKIEFYYILMNYILKNPIFIYDIHFLEQTRKYIRKLIKKNNGKLVCRIEDKEIEKKVQYLIGLFSNDDYKKYYINKSSNMENILLKRFTDFKHNNNSNTKKERKTYHKQQNGKKLNNAKENSQLECIKYLYDILSNEKYNKTIKELMTSDDYNQEKVNEFLFNDLKIRNKDQKELTKKILMHHNVKSFINKNDKKNNDFTSLIKNVFHFNLGNEEIKNIKGRLPCNTNAKSVQIFKNIFNKEKENGINGIK